MSKPPEDEETFLRILQQIKEALSETSVIESEDEEVMEELHEGIRNSLQALMGVDFKDEQPKITVVDGGISDKETVEKSSEENKPQLTLLSSNDINEGDDPKNWGRSDVKVRVVSGNALFQLGKNQKRKAPPEGFITLSEGESQTILKSEQKYLYRISCKTGVLRLQALDAEFLLKEAQSVDVESNHLVVLAEEESIGQYFRV